MCECNVLFACMHISVFSCVLRDYNAFIKGCFIIIHSTSLDHHPSTLKKFVGDLDLASE